MKLRGSLAVAVAGLVLAGCSGQVTESAPPTPATSTTPTTQTWSNEAVTACRQFVNAVPNWTLVQSQLKTPHPTTTAQWDQAVTGWGLATAGVRIPANLGQDAEPEVAKALSELSAALETTPVGSDNSRNPDYVNSRMIGFKDAIAACADAGVTSPSGS